MSAGLRAATMAVLELPPMGRQPVCVQGPLTAATGGEDEAHKGN